MKKKNIIFISVLVICFACYVVLFYFISGSNHATEGYLIVSELGGYYCKAKSCSYKSIDEMDLLERNIRIYQQNQLQGTYQLKYINRFNFFQNGLWKNLYGDFFGVDESLDANIFNYHYESMNSNDERVIKEVLLNQQISSYKKLDTDQVLVMDLDENGVEDRILTFSNQTLDENDDIYFSSLLILLNGKVQTIYFEKSSEKYQVPYYNVFSIFSLNKEKKPRLIINKGYYDQTGDPSIMMLQLDGKKVKEIVSDSAKK